MRKTVGKARVTAAKKPELLSKVAAAEVAGEKARAVLLEKPYDAQLPATTVGEKRPASHWRQREVDETCAKAVKLANAATAAGAAAEAAYARCERVINKALKLPRGSHAQQKAHATYEAATVHRQVAQDDMEAAVAVAYEAAAEASEARAAAEAAEAMASASGFRRPRAFKLGSAPELL